MSGQEGFRFRSGVDLINVTATVTDRSGRFLPGLTKDDFEVYEDSQPVEITHFSSERSPVSLGIALDTSGSMQGEKWSAARDAIDRFLQQLSDPEDEFFLYRFSGGVDLVQDWTNDRRAVSWSLGRVNPNGGTAMYDGVAEAVPMAQSGRNRKKAVVVISDGNDTSSRSDIREVKQLVRESEVLVYAVGIDGQGTPTIVGRPRPPIGGGPRFPIPFPFPGGRGGGGFPVPRNPGGGGGGYSVGVGDRVNVSALREITDDSGGRTEIVRDAQIDGHRQHRRRAEQAAHLGYPSPGHRDGRWHSIRVRSAIVAACGRAAAIATP